ncbi:MAG: hypothetical protein JO362_00675 [Streptomycetaceae bacterium]|nr:hypothetical protein [Streptomycetaceae bacterium]
MSRTSNHRTVSRRALRREVPGTVALLVDGEDFMAMRSYTSFTFADHAQYLEQMQQFLRSLAAQGVHVTVTLFDPAEYTRYCEDTGQEPDTAVTRTRYTAEVAAFGAAVAYQGQPIDRLIAELMTEVGRRATWEQATRLLARDNGCERCDGGSGGKSHGMFERASYALMRVFDSVGAGVHHLVCSIPAEGEQLIGVLHAECDEHGNVRLAESEALVFCTVLAAGLAIDSPGGMVMRTSRPCEPERVRGWSLHDGWLQPLTEAEVFNAYCTDAATGEPVPPEPGVIYSPGTELLPCAPHTR